MARGHHQGPGAGRLAAFVGPCLPLAGFGLPLTIHLPTFYARDLGLPLSAVGVAFLLVRLADIGLDPVLGALMDRTRTRLGRFRPWLIGAVPVLMAASGLLFMARPGVGPAYLWFALVVGYAGFSMGSLSQQAWASVLSPDYDGRSRIYGWWQAGNVVGMLLILTTPAVVQFGLHGSRVDGIRAMGWLLILSLPATVALACWRVGEPARPGPTARPAAAADYLRLLRHRSMAPLMAADLLLGWAPGITGALFLFYFDQVKHVPDAQANLMLLAYFVAALFGAPLWSWLATRVGKHRALACNALFVVASLIVVWLTPLASPLVGFPVMALAGLPYSGASLLLRAMLADVGDELELQTGEDRTGLLYAVLTGTTKIGSALALLTFVILASLGFDAQSAHNAPAAVAGLQALFVAAPALLSALAAAVILTYPLDARRHAEIRTALDARAAAPPRAAAAE
jgi:Na+/melibiose symporter-like transporter